MRTVAASLMLAAASGAASAAPDSLRYRADLGIETRIFPNKALDSRQRNFDAAVTALAHIDYAWNDGRSKLSIVPFLRLDSTDPERSHADLREFECLHRHGDWDFRAGIGKVFWGKTEFVHLVDIVNQTDAVESIDFEDKLGQPLLGAAYTTKFGVLTALVLPWFRERTLPGAHGRLRASIPYDLDNAEYESSRETRHIDFALRWSYAGDAVDIGIAHFSGTAREPRFEPRGAGSQLRLVPVYDLIDQTSIDAGYVSGGWLWKLEALYQSNRIANFAAAVGGFEYTLTNTSTNAAEVGLLLEYAWDNRPRALAAAFQNDLFLGIRWSLNDVAGTELLAGIGQDLEFASRFVSLDASRRLGDNSRLSVKLRVLDSTNSRDPLYELRRDDHLLVEYVRYF